MQIQLNHRIDAISHDHKSGAAEIVETTLSLLLDIGKLGVSSSHVATQLFNRCIRCVYDGQPTMAPVLNLLNSVCLAKEQSKDDWSMFLNFLEHTTRGNEKAIEIMISKVGEIPPAPETLITFSNSSTVVKIIQTCSQKFQWPKRILLSEARPVMEGISMAQKLALTGLQIEFYTDAALMSKVDSADAVWVGGDSFNINGLVNKTGSKSLAVLAKSFGIPFISIMATDKFLPKSLLKFQKFPSQNPREILQDDDLNLKVCNEYYENVPLKFVTGVFSEQGLIDPDILKNEISDTTVSSLFESLAG